MKWMEFNRDLLLLNARWLQVLGGGSAAATRTQLRSSEHFKA
jgi:hypothetical protein